jgi:hypothetical protein
VRRQCLVCFLLSTLVYGQSSQTATLPAATDKDHEVKVGSDDPVITVNGFCADLARQGDICKTVITRAQFEKLTDALQPGMLLSLRLNVANAYAHNLRMSAAAEKRGLDKTPEFEEEMHFARMQLLAQDLSRTLQAEANNITDADLEDYYQKNESAYEQAIVARIFVPHAKQVAPIRETHADASSEEAMTKLAIHLHARAVNGEDPDKLQIEAYAGAGITQTSSNTKMVNVRRATLPRQHETIMDLKAGEVSQVFSDPGGAHFIYKMISKKTLTLEDAKAEIRTQISGQRYRDSMKNFQGDVVFSDAYFNPPGNLAAPPQRNRKRKRSEPLAPDDENHD